MCVCVCVCELCVYPRITGKFGLVVQNEAGQSLREFCQENMLQSSKHHFQNNPRLFYTWTSPDGQYQNQNDYVLCIQRWTNSIQSVKPRPGADCGTDHGSLFQNSGLN